MHQNGEQVEFRRGEVNGLPVHFHRVQSFVQFHVADVQPLVTRSLRIAAAQYGLNAGRQLAHAEGFDDVIVGAEFQPEHGVRFLHPRGQDDHRRCALETVLPEEFVSVHFRHQDIQQHRIGLFVTRGVERFPAVARSHHAITLFSQVIGDQVADAEFIVHDEDRLGHAVIVVPAGILDAGCRQPDGGSGGQSGSSNLDSCRF